MGFPLVRSIAVLATALTLVSCAGRRGQLTAPAEPESAVRGFLDAVRGNSLVAMGDLWGTARGPASRTMDRDELEKRLTVIRAYLRHEQFDILPPDVTSLMAEPANRVVRVRLTREGCTAVVPFTVVRTDYGWIVSDIDLAAAGDPARPCVP